MTITARVVEDSISLDNVRLITVSLEYQNFFHPEVMTHRDKSRNAHSNRAIPSKRLRRWVLDNMATPIHWGTNRPGMVAGAELTGWRLWAAKNLWRLMGYVTVMGVWGLEIIGLHKQISNRPLGPYIHTKVVCTATQWDNMFLLRDANDAQPEFHQLAMVMRDAMNESVPTIRNKGEWHLPYVTLDERSKYSQMQCIRMSVARCARVSYLTHEGKQPDIAKDDDLYNHLLSSGHMSPFEHQACPSEIPTHRSGNFIGWTQYRKCIPNECRDGYKPLRRWKVFTDKWTNRTILIPGGMELV